MRTFKKIAFLLFCIIIGILCAGSAEASQCVACHTDLKGLIRLCWEVEKIKPAPEASGENSGEG